MLRLHPILRTLVLASALACGGPVLRSLGAQRLLASARHTSWSETEGLPLASMDRVLRSPDGYLWLGGEGPLVRFDGVRFTIFDGSNTPALASRVTGGLRPRMIDRDGVMWISRADGALVQYRDGQFRVAIRPRGSVRYVGQVAQDRTGRIWAVTTPSALCYIEGDSLIRAPLPSWLAHADVLTLMADTADGVWLGTRTRGLVHLTPRGAESFRDTTAVLGGAPRPLILARDGAIWVSYEGLRVLRNGRWTHLTPRAGERFIPSAASESADGAVWITTRGHGVVRVMNGRLETFTERDGLSDALAVSIDIDQERNVWVVTEAGLDRLQPAPFTSVGPSRGLPFDSPKWIAPDASGAIWAVAFPGQELYWLDGGIIRGEPGQVTGKPRGASTTAEFRALNPARDSGVWVYDGRMHRIVRVTTDRVIPTSPSIGDYVTIAFENTRRQLWAAAGGNPLGWASRGTWQRGILPNESDTALTHQIGEDASGRMLVLRDPDLYVIDSGRVIRTIGPENGLARVNRQVVVDGVDTLWTQDNDSSLYRIIGTQVSRVSSAALVPHLASRSTALVPAGDKFFIASSSGITSVSRAALHATADGRAPFPAMRRYSALDGASMARLTVQNVSAAFTATDGRIWFSTPAGLLVYDARDDGPNAVAPVVHIEEVRAVDSVLARDSIVRVPPGAERVQFRFTATALRLPERARLEFKLDGIDANWRLADATRTVTYTQLRPHRYTFRVRAWNEDGVPAAAAALSLRVMPLWYQSWWFISLAVLAAIGSTAGVVALALRARQRVVASRLAAGFEATLAERTRLAGELHDTLLQAFTGVTLQLQALRSRIVAAPQEVERDIGRVLTVADGALREARSAVWDMRAPELEGRDVAAALEDSARDAIDAHTLAGGAPVELVVTVSGRRRRVAPVIEIAAHRIGREAVANALRHASAKQVSLTIDFEPRHLCLEVRDNGVGFDISGVTPTEGRGHWGLVGMRERARNAGGSLDVASIPGSGTVLILRLPIAPT